MTMAQLRKAAVAALLLTGVLFSVQAHASADKLEAAERLVAATRLADNARALYQQQVSRIMGSLQSQNPNAPGRAFDILEEELEGITPEVVDQTTKVAVDMYQERFTPEEMNEISTFYESVVGQKALSEMRSLAAARATKGQEIGQRLGAEAAGRAMERIRLEGLQLR